MKVKKMKKMLAAVLGTSMVMGTAITAMAEDASGDITAPIYSFDVTQVIVPTTYAVAFNPEGLSVKVNSGDASGDVSQILSKNYGIVNKSNKDKLIKVSLTVADQNAGSGITFVDSSGDVEAAEDGEYKIHLTAIPADTSEVKVGTTPASADKDTSGDALDNVSMSKAAGNAVTLKSGANQLGFKLDKATYSPKSGNEVTLGSTSTNDVKNNYEITGLAAAGKGITAFTFGGEMNTNTDWSKLASGIKISVVYSNETATSAATVVSGTGAMVSLAPTNAAPAFTTGDGVGEIKYTAGSGDDALASITKIEMEINGDNFDGFTAWDGVWAAAANSAGVVKFDAAYMKFYQDAFPSDTTRQATVTYTTAGGETKTGTVTVKLR